MLNDFVIDALWRAHTGLTLGLLIVLLLRRPWRRFAGAQAAYALWLLPLWLAAVALLPRASVPGWALPPVLVQVGQASTLAEAPTAAPLPIAGIWAAGVLGVAALNIALHWRYRRRLRQASDGHLLAPAGDSPGLLGLWRARLVLPADFRQRFDASERRWILAHEIVHARRLDNPARMFATALTDLAWFNPLAWWALGALRHDQELACDAAVMQRYPGCWRRYGLAMLKLDDTPRLPPTASAWQSHHPLKERIMLLKKAAPNVRVRQAAQIALVLSAMLGFGAVQALNAGSTAAASTTKPTTRASEMTDVTAHPSKVKVIEACPQMPQPEPDGLLQDKDLKGEYRMNVEFRIGVDGHPDWVRINGRDRKLAPMVEKAVRAYGCNRELAGTWLQQEFEFRFD